MKTFYVVAIGDYYSDYHVIAIADNKERAENIKIYIVILIENPIQKSLQTAEQRVTYVGL